MDLDEDAAQLSDYWKLEDENQPTQTNAAGCRGTNSINGNRGSLAVEVNDSAFPASFTGCTKFWGNNPVGGINYGVLIPDGYPGVNAPNRAKLAGHFVISPGEQMAAGTQCGAFVATIDTNHQVLDANNPPSYVCGGCQDGVCLFFSDLILYQPTGTPGGNLEMTNQDKLSFVIWQGGIPVCLGAEPTRHSTWGQVKSLYR